MALPNSAAALACLSASLFPSVTDRLGWSSGSRTIRTDRRGQIIRSMEYSHASVIDHGLPQPDHSIDIEYSHALGQTVRSDPLNQIGVTVAWYYHVMVLIGVAVAWYH
jgi:hypothetical protein